MFFVGQPVANTFEGFEAPSKNFLATPLLYILGKLLHIYKLIDTE